MEQYAITAEAQLMKEVDRIIKETRLYNSRNEFVRESIRAHLIEVRKTMIAQSFENLASKIKKQGKKPRILTKEEKQELFKEFLKEIK